ncbi:hypothetical protein RGR602_PB00270 (plasmid) [Rhizobium gallicum bv. gallicum R602sp]|uniref:Uncharacterized protein n=1 Tax=Rhizobium gallicum bv. gallicum R602sp TaxID=1041138 RepID=A0A0B4XAL7_9HYPH|nr:hypothetical protein RGR602_PB00270 [Rhizobium gallicum bv. gallicum R602sp]
MIWNPVTRHCFLLPSKPFAENASPAKRGRAKSSSATLPTSCSATPPDDMLSGDQIVVRLEVHRCLSAEVEIISGVAALPVGIGVSRDCSLPIECDLSKTDMLLSFVPWRLPKK